MLRNATQVRREFEDHRVDATLLRDIAAHPFILEIQATIAYVRMNNTDTQVIVADCDWVSRVLVTAFEVSPC